MKNTKNKVIAGFVCGMIMGSMGTAFIGNAEANAPGQIISNPKGDSQTLQSQENNVSVSPKINPNVSPNISPNVSPNINPNVSPNINPNVSPNINPNVSPNVSVVTDGKYTDGTYVGTAEGYEKGLTVEVQITNGNISNVQVVSHNETPGYYERAFRVVPSEIIKSQSTKVDTVSGATYSSKGIIKAVDKALSEAKK